MLDAIAARSSIRKFKNTPVPRHIIEEIIKAGALAIMRQAPVIIFVVNPLGLDLLTPQNAENRVFEICNAQSIGAAVENMSLAAVENGLGSLWICDIYFAYRELCAWLNCGGELAAAFALGYAGEAPMPRPRKNFDDIVEWRS